MILWLSSLHVEPERNCSKANVYITFIIAAQDVVLSTVPASTESVAMLSYTISGLLNYVCVHMTYIQSREGRDPGRAHIVERINGNVTGVITV